jgi:hypothetical protein
VKTQMFGEAETITLLPSTQIPCGEIKS